MRFLGVRIGFNSTGTLLEGEYLLTAAHNLYDSWRTRLISVQVSCKGRDGNLETSIVMEDDIQRARKVGHYNKTYSTDYAFLKLDERLPVQESVSLNRALNVQDIHQIEVAGYPGGLLKYARGNLVRPVPGDATIYYQVDTAKGMSGGPVWAEYQGVESIVGVHVSEGRARLVDNELIDDFEQWKKYSTNDE